jgi:hypothetical protein
MVGSVLIRAKNIFGAPWVALIFTGVGLAMLILLASPLTPPMTLSDLAPSVPVVQVHSDMSELDVLAVVEDELYHDGLRSIHQWIGDSSQAPPPTVDPLVDPPREETRIYRGFVTFRRFWAHLVRHIRYIYATLTMVAFVEGF